MKQQSFTIDFGRREGTPLFKKFALFNSGLVPIDRHERDMELIERLKPESLRIDLFMGHDEMPFGRLVTGTQDDPVLSLELLERWARALLEHGVLPYMAWCYFPEPLQKNGDWRSGPTDLDAWRKLLAALSQHFREAGIPLRYQEVYNEPDCHEVFYTGSWEDYLQLYRYGALGLQEGNPDAMIGGPSAAFVKRNDITGDSLETFLDFVDGEDLPLDFFSFHSYGYESKEYLHRSRLVRERLKGRTRFDTTEMHMNELNIVPFPWDQEPTPLNAHEIAPHLLDCMTELLDETDITLVHWAQFLNSGVDHLGVVDTEGRVKPLYHVLAMYAHMPIERYRAISTVGAVKAMASADGSKACVMLWNPGVEPRAVTVDVRNLPFAVGNPAFYTINEASYGRQEWVEAEGVAYDNRTFTVVLGAKEVLYVVFPALEQVQPLLVAPAERIIRKRHYYPNRGQRSYAYLSETDWTAWLGNGGESEAFSLVAFEAEGFVPYVSIQAELNNWEPIDGQPSRLGVRVDYRCNQFYTKAMEWTIAESGPQGQPSTGLPWGSGGKAGLVLETDGFVFRMPVAAYAPADWDGRAIMSFFLMNGGRQAKARIQIQGIQ